MSRPARALLWGVLACAPAGVAVLCAPRVACAQSSLVVTLPMTGQATDELRDEVERQVRGAVVARGDRSPDAATVRGSLGVDVPTDPTAIVGFGRGMGAQYVIAGSIAPLTGQYTLVLRLYEVSTGRFAEQRRLVASGDEAEAIPAMVAALFAPGAIQPTPEERAREEEERRRQEEERLRQEREADARRQQDEDARRRQDEERRRQEEARRNATQYRWDRGGPFALGASLLVGARVTPTQPRPPNAPPAESLLAGLRIDGAYAIVPSAGFEAGLAAMVLGSPTNGLGIGAMARVTYPTAGSLPLRGSAGVNAGVFHALTGSQATAAWLGVDVRGEYSVTDSVALYAGAEVDWMPGLFASVAGSVGARVRLGGSTAPASGSTSNDASAGTQNTGGGSGDGAGASDSSASGSDHSVPGTNAP